MEISGRPYRVVAHIGELRDHRVVGVRALHLKLALETGGVFVERFQALLNLGDAFNHPTACTAPPNRVAEVAPWTRHGLGQRRRRPTAHSSVEM